MAYTCYIVSIRAKDDTINFEADSIDAALKIASKKIDQDVWEPRFLRGDDDDDAMDGLVATYRTPPVNRVSRWMLYIHEGGPK